MSVQLPTRRRNNRTCACSIAIAIVVGLAMSAQTRAQSGAQNWTAMSNTAMSITGDIELSPSALTLAGESYPLVLVQNIAAPQLAAAGEIVAMGQPTAASLYKLTIPATTKLVNGNTICGPNAANWLLTVIGTSPPVQTDQMLSLAFFSGSGQPDLASASSSTSLCGTFSYTH
jgi:hypothetical protein